MRRALPIGFALVAALIVGLGIAAAPARADARVTVVNDRGGAAADLTYQTRMTVSGAGFQVVRGGFGGVYVLFGWVRDPSGGSWRPSKGGLTGRDYQYIPDAEDAADNRGYLTYVAFPGSSTSEEAAAVLTPSGGFRVEVTIPGPVFQSVDRDGAIAEVDCRRQQCGVITIGAHGVKNARNETFTPVDFDTVYEASPPSPAATSTPAGPDVNPSSGPTNDPANDSSDVPSTTDPADPTIPAGPATVAIDVAVAVDRATATAGHAMAFVGRGFQPGEQVLAVLDDGAAAVGPLLAGTSGEVAGILQLPLQLGTGTHELRLTGAASGTEASERFPVAGAPTATSVTTSEEPPVAATIFLVMAGCLLIASLVGLVLRRRRSQAA